MDTNVVKFDQVETDKTKTEPFQNETKECIETDLNYKVKYIPINIITHATLNLCCLYGYYLMFYAHYLTIFWGFVLEIGAILAITIGAHRFYSHKSFKTIPAIRMILVALQSMSGQQGLWFWVRDHRLHHKYSDTDADPHNADRGFFFSHYGWAMSERHPLVIAKGKEIDLSDLREDKFVMFQKAHIWSMIFFWSAVIPTIVPMYFWNETLVNALFIGCFARMVTGYHISASINSFAHYFGAKPFDKSIRPVQSPILAALTLGEGWHNYHHCFPWDYRTSEFGSKFNFSTTVIDWLAAMNWAYDLKTAPYDMAKHRAMKKGDGSHPVFGNKAI